ncbi:MAG: ABC transporter ATP-binding protein [Candidatus Faecivicinus sp.]|nr:ABC transporter ATP-binding protein [Candidatus Faecivicinus sp.]
MALITMKDVTIAFEGVAAVKNASFSVEKGDYLVILGENGSGKSTLVRAILGLVRPAKGQILYGDGLKRAQIGYLPQKSAAQRDFPASVEEVVRSGLVNRLGGRMWLGAQQKRRAAEKMRLMDVENMKNRPYRTLSGGQQQRVLLARALCATDSILLLDEPVTGLDPDATEEMYGVIRALNREHNTAIVMVSHDVNAALRDANKVLVMDHGVDFFGTVEKWKSERRVNA